MALLRLILVACAFFPVVLGKLRCENLPVEDCAFAVSSSGARCALEKYVAQDDSAIYQCQTTSIQARNKGAWIETELCLNACGLDRMTLGFSTDILQDRGSASKLCSQDCQNNCPNIIDLYLKLAAEEGYYLPQICENLRSNARLLISGGPSLPWQYVPAPASAPAASP